MQDDELVAADFFEADTLPRLPPHGTIARRLIALCLDDRLREAKRALVCAPSHLCTQRRRQAFEPPPPRTKWYHIRHFMLDMTQELG